MISSVGLKLIASPLLGLLMLQGDSCRSPQTSNTAQPTDNRTITPATNEAAANRTANTNEMQNRDQMRNQAQITKGVWGGKTLNLHVAEENTQIELSCAHGMINEPLRLDSNGRFEAAGTYTAEGPGPVREGASNTYPARYSGEVKGNVMTLTITLTDSKQNVGTFVIEHDKAVKIVKCL